MPLICVELLGIWALLKAEVSVKAGWKWRLLAGSTVGIGFMIKSIMVMLPIAALLPYLIWQHRRHRHLTSPALYLGLILGSIPSAVWFLLTYQHYGIAPFKELFEKLVLLGSKPYNSDGTIIYYFWNIPLNSFPWVFFAFLGMKILWSQFSLSHNHKTPISILIFYPVLLFFLLTSFSTRTPYYALQLYPFIGLLAAIALDWLAYRPYADLPRIICYLFGGLAAILLVAFTVLSSGAITISEEIRKYLLIAPILGIGWLALPFLWYQYQQEYRQYSEDQSSKSLQSKRVSVLMIVFFITPWLTLTTAGMSGLWGNYSHDVKSYLQQSEFASILQTQPINFVVPNITDSEMHVTWVLLSFYTPHLGKPINSVNELLPDSYAWISPNVPIPESAKSLGNIRNWQLIKVQK
jgi:4-amino-4-deoxy-L-arabinose transferase-like glycosyltransferase